MADDTLGFPVFTDPSIAEIADEDLGEARWFGDFSSYYERNQREFLFDVESSEFPHLRWKRPHLRWKRDDA